MIILPLLAVLLRGQAALSGHAIRIGTDTPVAQARVLLTKVDGQITDSITTTTGDDGSFDVPNIPPGTYHIFAVHEDFVRAETGQARAGQPGLPVTLKAGERLPDVLLTMTPTGVISGRVLDEFNEPVSDVYVRAQKTSYVKGERLFSVVIETKTNDLGEYRLAELARGRYFISAAPYSPPHLEGARYVTPTPPRLDARGEGFAMQSLNGVLNSGGFIDPLVLAGETKAQTYNPGTIDPVQARPLELGAGAALTGIDLRATRIHVARVRGDLIEGSTGALLSGANVSLIASTGRMTLPFLPGSATSSFDVSGLAPGSYVVRATTQTLSGSVRWTSVARTSKNLRVVLTPRFSVDGHVTMEGLPAGMQVQLEGSRLNARANVQAGGTFTISLVETGEYRVSITGLPANAYLKSARLGEADVLDNTMRLELAPKSRLELVVSANDGNLKAIATPGSILALVPEASKRKRFDLYRTALADSSGRAHIEGIAPGNYKVFAWNDIEDNAWQDPEVLRTYENRGLAVAIEESSTNQVTLQTIH